MNGAGALRVSHCSSRPSTRKTASNASVGKRSTRSSMAHISRSGSSANAAERTNANARSVRPSGSSRACAQSTSAASARTSGSGSSKSNESQRPAIANRTARQAPGRHKRSSTSTQGIPGKQRGEAWFLRIVVSARRPQASDRARVGSRHRSLSGDPVSAGQRACGCMRPIAARVNRRAVDRNQVTLGQTLQKREPTVYVVFDDGVHCLEHAHPNRCELQSILSSRRAITGSMAVRSIQRTAASAHHATPRSPLIALVSSSSLPINRS